MMNLNGSVFWCFSISLRYTSRLAFATELVRSNLSPADSSREAASSVQIHHLLWKDQGTNAADDCDQVKSGDALSAHGESWVPAAHLQRVTGHTEVIQMPDTRAYRTCDFRCLVTRLTRSYRRETGPWPVECGGTVPSRDA